MFARKPATPNPMPNGASEGPDWLATLSNPYVGAGAAAALVVAATLALIAITGDPRAGAPSLRIPLQSPDPSVARLLRPSATPGAPGGVPLDGLASGQELTLPGAADAPIQGQAVITLPQGASVGGGEAVSASAAQVQAPLVRNVGQPLAHAPIAGLSAPGPGGPLPVIAPDGRTPFQAYARPFHDNGKPKVALVIGGLGLNATATRSAIERLPPEVTLSFVSYSDGLQGWIDQARAAGHEVMLEIPMEPLDYPNNDPGPYALMANASSAETSKRLEWLLSRGAGYFAVTNYLGGRFLNSPSAMAAFTGVLKARGLGFIDDGAAARRGAGVARASAGAVIDEQLSADGIDKALLGLEAQALQRGSALGAGFSYPVTIEQVGRWAQGLAGRGYQLAPASAIVPPMTDETPPPEHARYRPNVGIVVFNASGLVWLGRRRGAAPPRNWQFPQGGVDAGEDLLAAARRELQEETGITSVSLLARAEGWITYDFPSEFHGSKVGRGYQGQTQAWFAFRFDGDDAEIDLYAHHHPEFDAWRWATLAQAGDLIVPFKRDAYAKVIAAFKDLAPPTR